MFKRLITKIGNAFKPNKPKLKVWKRDPIVQRATGKSLREVLDKDPHKHLEISIVKIKGTNPTDHIYVDVSEERQRWCVEYYQTDSKKNIGIHSHSDYPLPSFSDLRSDINRWLKINRVTSKQNIQNLPMTVIVVKDQKTHEPIGTTCYTIRGFKDKLGNLTDDPKFALSQLSKLSNPYSLFNYKWTAETLIRGRAYDYKTIKKYLDINFKFIPEKGYTFNKKKFRFEKIK